MKSLFDDYLDALKEEHDEDDWYNQIHWSPGVNALTEHRRQQIQSALRSGRMHRSFPRLPWQPPVDHTR